MAKLITAIVTQTDIDTILKTMREKMDVQTANYSRARGESLITGESIEVFIISVLVKNDKADAVFEYLYEECQVYKQHRGMLFQNDIAQMSDYGLPSDDEIKRLNQKKENKKDVSDSNKV
ncbi:MAG: hypothetical protein ACQESH_01640 [Campylobacterota bacterium]